MLGRGLTFEEHSIGARYHTLARTVSETDIVNFVNQCGFTEPLFMDMEFVQKESVFGRRAAPGALTFALSEGLIMQTGLIHGTGMAWLGGEIRVVAPVTYAHRVLNQRSEMVLEARVQRMIRRADVAPGSSHAR